MAVVDYEQAWIRLQAVVAGKSQHGREPLLVEMAEIAADCRVAEGEKVRLLRLYGVDVGRVERPQSHRDTAPSSGGDDVAAGTGSDPATLARQGGHDGSATARNGRAVAA